MPVRQANHVNGIIQIFGIFTVNGNKLSIAIISQPRFKAYSLIQSIGCFRYFVREGKRQTVTCHNNLYIQVLIARIAENFRNFAFRLLIFLRPCRNLYGYSCPGTSVQGFIQGNVHIFM